MPNYAISEGVATFHERIAVGHNRVAAIRSAVEKAAELAYDKGRQDGANPPLAAVDPAAVAGVLRTAGAFSMMTDDEVAAVLEIGDDFDRMAAKLLEVFRVTTRG